MTGGKIILAGGKIILAGGKIILAGGKIILTGGKIIWAGGKIKNIDIAKEVLGNIDKGILQNIDIDKILY